MSHSDFIATYMESLVTEPDSPFKVSATTFSSTAESGKTLFNAKGCADCHSGAVFTDSAEATLHYVGTITASTGTGTGTETGQEGSFILSPTDDIYNHASATGVKSALSFSRWTHVFMKFDGADIADDIATAKLRLYYLGSDAIEINVWRVDDDDWSETGTELPVARGYSWYPDRNLAAKEIDSAGYVEFDVSDFVKAEQ